MIMTQTDMGSNSTENSSLNAPRFPILILQHPSEKKEKLATVPLIQEVLPAVNVKMGLSWPNLATAWNGKRGSGSGGLSGTEFSSDWMPAGDWWVFYLGSKELMQTIPPQNPTPIWQVKKNKTLEAFEIKNPPKGIVLLDGTWPEVKAMWWRNPWLSKLKRLVLKPVGKSLYREKRKEPRKEAISTLESLAMILKTIDSDRFGNVETRLLARLQELLK
jgi:DTW domain-containing protein